MLRVEWDHVQVFARDPAGVAAWFARHFGAEVSEGPGRLGVTLAGATLFIARGPEALLEGPAHPHAGFDHIGLKVADLSAAVAELEAAGVVITQGPKVLRPGVSCAFIAGPEGICIELLQRA